MAIELVYENEYCSIHSNGEENPIDNPQSLNEYIVIKVVNNKKYRSEKLSPRTFQQALEFARLWQPEYW